MKMYRKFKYGGALCGTAMIGVLLMCGCSNSKIKAAGETDIAVFSEEEPLTFTIWSDEETYVRKVVEAYNALKGREEIYLEVIANADHDDWIEAYSEDYEVDIIDLRGNSQLLMLQRKGYLLGLGNYIQESDLDVTAYGNMFNEIVYDGEYYGLPARSTCWALYYNKEIFDEAGVAYPEQMTWEEYLELAALVRSEEKGVWGGCYLPWIYHIMAVQQGYYLLDDNLDPIAENLAFLQKLYNDGNHIPFAEIKEHGDECSSLFEEGKFAMLISGEWQANMFLEDEANGIDVPEWGIAPLPVPENVETNTTIGMYQFVGITSTCKDPKRAFEFLEFLCGEEGALIYARNAIIPGYSNEEIQQAYRVAVGTEQASIFFSVKKVQEQPMWYNYDRLMDLFEADASAFLEGKYTLDETMQLFDQQRRELFQ